jgi:hypothetical protein
VRYDFSAQFLRVDPPDTSFADAWESLCFALLDAEFNDTSLIRLRPPDKGVDILHRSAQHAYQCKSTERGAFGSMDARESIRSLQAAFPERNTLNWSRYSFATNASYTATAFTSIKNEAETLGLLDQQIGFLGPEYWDKLCKKHTDVIADRFDYRIPVTKLRVAQAFENQRYFPNYVMQYSSKIEASELVLRIKNNRTPIILEVPFSPDLTVEHLMDVIKDLLGVSLEWTNYNDLGTSAGPSISLAIGRTPQSFAKKIGELEIDLDEGLQFWITIVWRDERRADAVEDSKRLQYRLHDDVTLRSMSTYKERQQHTIARSEEIIEAMIWNGAKNLKGARESTIPD